MSTIRLVDRLLPATLFAIALAAVLARLAAAQTPAKVTCTFVNPAYTGACVETATRTGTEEPEAACRPILECLNNSQCAKSYCQATAIRSGWTLKSAE